jgi:type II secretory pathway pseudopilin PulG
MRTGEHGFTYLLLLFALAVGAAGLATLGQSWQQAMQREREAELLFRGRAIERALARYAAGTPDGLPNLPATLAELLEDRRSGVPQRHLRRLYADPFTGRPDWLLLRRAVDGRIVGVRSRARAPALRTVGVPEKERQSADRAAVGDWRFVPPVAAADAAPASAPSPDEPDEPDEKDPRGDTP